MRSVNIRKKRKNIMYRWREREREWRVCLCSEMCKTIIRSKELVTDFRRKELDVGIESKIELFGESITPLRKKSRNRNMNGT
jgi:hypothetical protein